LLAPRPTPKLEDHPLSAVHDCLFNLFAATLHKGGRSSIRNLRTRHAVVTETHYTAKTLLFKTLIGPVLTYGTETWALSKQDEYRLSIFESKILRRNYGPVIDKGEWRIRTNRELYQMYDEKDIVKFCKLSRLRWQDMLCARMTTN